MTFSRWWPLALCLWGSLAAAAPVSATLGKIHHEYQRLNNCAPVTALNVLNYYESSVTQTQAAAVMKDGSNDPQVTSLELAAYLEGLPVIVQQRL